MDIRDYEEQLSIILFTISSAWQWELVKGHWMVKAMYSNKITLEQWNWVLALLIGDGALMSTYTIAMV